jgi:hypothetical protein
MKIFRSLFILLIFGACCLAAAGQDRAAVFDRPLHDFGKLNRGEHRQTVFTVVNEGDVPLLLTDVSTACRCLRLGWPRKPLAPGESAEIAVTYRGRDRGSFYREIVVRTSASSEPHSLFVKGLVE